MRYFVTTLFFLLSASVYAAGCFPSFSKSSAAYETGPCCNDMGGVSYCDSSTGRLVCRNGFFSSCYCHRHAVMDLQETQGCCVWQGGVMAVTLNNVVVCNDGGYSELCTRLK